MASGAQTPRVPYRDAVSAMMLALAVGLLILMGAAALIRGVQVLGDDTDERA